MSLVKDTAVYGLSSIVGRFLNYLLIPLYTAVLPAESGGYGVVSNVYAYTALILVFLTFGMETGLFRYANKPEENPVKVFSNVAFFVGGLASLFVVLGLVFLNPVSAFLGYPGHRDYVGMMMVTVAVDSFLCIPFAWLRYRRRAVKFASVKLFNIAGSIVLNLFFLLLCPLLHAHAPSSVSWFYNPDYTVGYIFVSNLVMSAVQALFFIPELRMLSLRPDFDLQKRMLCYSFPVLVFGVVGILNQTVDKMIFPFLYEDRQEGLVQLGIYSAASKVAMVMTMFTQAFRYAYEPFVFGSGGRKDSASSYASVMKYFLIFSLLAFLAVMFYMDILKYMVSPGYWEGLDVVAIVMGAEMLKGIYFNLSFWYKLTDETRWGAYFSLIGCAVILVLNVSLVPRYGYEASAWASVAGYGIITVLSYFVGHRKYPVDYPLKDMFVYLVLATVLYAISIYVCPGNTVLRIVFRTLLLSLFVARVIRKDLPLGSIPFINRFMKK